MHGTVMSAAFGCDQLSPPRKAGWKQPAEISSVRALASRGTGCARADAVKFVRA